MKGSVSLRVDGEQSEGMVVGRRQEPGTEGMWVLGLTVTLWKYAM